MFDDDDDNDEDWHPDPHPRDSIGRTLAQLEEISSNMKKYTKETSQSPSPRKEKSGYPASVFYKTSAKRSQSTTPSPTKKKQWKSSKNVPQVKTSRRVTRSSSKSPMKTPHKMYGQHDDLAVRTPVKSNRKRARSANRSRSPSPKKRHDMTCSMYEENSDDTPVKQTSKAKRNRSANRSVSPSPIKRHDKTCPLYDENSDGTPVKQRSRSKKRTSNFERLAVYESYSDSTPVKSRQDRYRSSSNSSSPKTPRKVSSRVWTDAKEQLLCTLWEDEPHLYDSKHPDYRRTSVRTQTFRRIAAQLDMEGIELLQLIKI